MQPLGPSSPASRTRWRASLSAGAPDAQPTPVRASLSGSGAPEAQPAVSSAALALRDPELRLLFGNIVLYAVCYNLQAPVLPALTQSFGADARQYGALQSLFALAQLLGGLLMGPLMDVYGARWGLIVSFLSGSSAYALSAAATSMPLLYASRIPTALQHAALAARIAVSTKARGAASQAALLGYISLSYSVGAIVGPVFGGMLAAHSLRTVSLVAAAGSLLSCASVALWLSPASPAAGGRRGGQAPGAPKLSVAAFARVASLPGVPALLAAKGVLSLVLSLFHGVFALAAATHFHLSPAGTGAILSATSVVTMATQALLIDWAASRFPARSVFASCVATMALSYAGLACARGIGAVVLCLVPMTVSSCVLFTVNTAQLNRAVGQGDRGSINAIDMSVSSAVRVFSPALGTWALYTYGFGSIGVAGATLLTLLLLSVELGERRRGR